MVDDVKKTPAETQVPTLSDVIEAWFKDHVLGTPLGGTTDLYNLALAAKEDLKKRLTKA